MVHNCWRLIKDQFPIILKGLKALGVDWYSFLPEFFLELHVAVLETYPSDGVVVLVKVFEHFLD